MKYKNIKLWGLFSTLIVAGGLVATDFAFGQFDYYDPYSNSNIDYFPMNPINTSPSRTDRSTGTSSNTQTGSTVSTPKTIPEKPEEKTETNVPCTNKPKPNPTNTRSVEIRDTGGKVFYLSPPKEEISDAKAYPETTQKIFKIIYDDNTGMQKDETEIGLITVDNMCYPKYGYIQNDAPAEVPDLTVPSDKTAARLDPETGKVYDEKTGELIPQARYDKVAVEIYYQDTQSVFGKVFTETTGYVNITVHASAPSSSASTPKCSKTTAFGVTEEQPYSFCYHWKVTLVGIMHGTADLKTPSSDGPTSLFTITYYKNSATVDEVTKNWYRVKKKKVSNKHNVSGFTYTLRDIDSSASPHYGAFLINKKSDGQEFVHIQFPDAVGSAKKSFRLPKEFKTLIKTFRFSEE